MKKRIKGIKEKISKLWKDKTSELKLKISLYTHNFDRAQETWMNMDDERQIYCAKYLPQILMTYKNNPYAVANIWRGTDKKVQKNKISEVIELVKDSPYLVGSVWRTTDKEGQKVALENNPKLLEEIIEKVKDNPNLVESVWNNTDKEVQKNKISEVIELVKDNPDAVAYIWRETDKEVQKVALEKNPKLLEEIIELVKDNPYLGSVWYNTDKEVQKNKISEVIELVKDNPDAVADIWGRTDKEVQKVALEKNPKLLEKIIELVKDNPDLVGSVWYNTDTEIQRNKIAEVIELVKDNPDAVADTWRETDKEVQKVALEKNPKLLEEIIEKVKDNPNLVESVWNNTDTEIQKNKIAEVIEKVKDNPDLVRSVWNNTDKEVQKNKIAEVIELVKDNPDAVEDIWRETDKKVQKAALENNPKILEEIIEKVKDDPYLVQRVWYNTDKKVQKVALEKNPKLLEEIIELVKDNPELVKEVWIDTDKEVQKNKIAEVIEKVKDDPDLVGSVWREIDKEVQKNKIAEVIEKVKVNKVLLQNIVKNTDSEIILNNLKNIYEKFTGKNEIPEQYEEKLKMLCEKNKNIFKNLNWKFLDRAIEEGYTDEQLLRITNFPETQEFILQYNDNKIMNNAIKYMLEKDSNWILSIERIKNNNENYKDLLNKLSINIKEEDIDDKFIQNVLLVISNRENYFNIQTVEDVKNYNNIKNNICENILNGKIENIPESLKKYPKEQQYKFALLEYKFGIDLEEAKFLINRYGTDAEKILEKMPHKLEAKYLYALKEIVESDNIEEIIEELRKNNALEKPWLGFPSARNAEGQIINMFAELYNETLYQPKEEDKNNQQEIYIDKEGNEHKINVYNINGDFDINIRVEGAYNPYWREPENFVDYYNYPDITTHGNCESFIGNDLIVSARFSRGVMVGYSIIRENNLTASGPHDLVSNTTNKEFSAYRAKSKFLTPKEMKDNTRHPHNEMVKDRIIIDENGNVARYMPNYAVWIEEDTEEERNQPGWKEEREKDEKWIMTKKLAAQLGIPIVVIDRERFAKREMEKIELLQKLINGEEVDGEKYGEYLKEYEGMSKPELIRESIIKFENNRVGIQFNKNLHAKYFTQKQFEQMVSNIRNAIDRTEPKEQIEMLRALLDVSKKEYNQIEIGYDDDIKQEKYAMQAFYNDCISRTKIEIENIEQKKLREQTYDKTELLDAMQRISRTDYYEGNKQHSIEHIQKVMLFSQVLAEGENLSEEDKKLLLVAAAFHDSGRKGLGEGNIPHAEPSAKKAGQLLRKENEFGKLSEEDITIIQTAIHYHEHKEKINGKIDYEEIERLSKKYAEENGIENLDIQRTAKMCELLKDADALDRYRFADRGTLNPQYLHSATAKKESTIEYAREVNEGVATKILKEVYGEENIQEGNAVSQLRDIRINKKIQEPHLDFEDIYTDTPLLYALDNELNNKKKTKNTGILNSLYEEAELVSEDISREQEKLIADLKRSKEQTKEQETQNNDAQGFNLGDSD